MDSKTLVAILNFTRQRLLGTLDQIEQSGQEITRVLSWRPGPGRAHIAWQAMHCAATHDKYLRVVIQGLASPADPALVAGFGGGTTPADENVPSLPQIRHALETHYLPFRDYIQGLSPAELQNVIGPPDRRRTIAEAAMLMAWHEAHHQGQIHLTWNLYRAAHGLAK